MLQLYHSLLIHTLSLKKIQLRDCWDEWNIIVHPIGLTKSGEPKSLLGMIQGTFYNF